MPLCPSRRGGSNLQNESITNTVTPLPAGAPILNSSNAQVLGPYLRGDNLGFTQKIAALFPNSVPLAALVTDFTADIANVGFAPKDAIPMISVCRDEITRPLVDAVEALWGNSFSLGSLAGMIFAGTTGLAAGMHHSPVVAGQDRFVFIVCPHIAIDSQGDIGKVWRPEVPTLSTACGALAGFVTAMQSGNISFELSTTDLEQTMLMAQLQSTFTYGQVPTLNQLTLNASQLILGQLQAALAAFELNEACYAVLSGVQIHGPSAQQFFYPMAYYTVDESGTQTPQSIAKLGAGGGASMLATIQTGAPEANILF